jgi:uncharacterized protein
LSRYLIRVANAKKYNRHQVREVAAEFQNVTSGCEVTLRNFRVGDYAVEFDLFSSNAEPKIWAVREIKGRIGDILTERDLAKEQTMESKELVVAEVVRLFNEQRYWECHEMLEGIWRIERDPNEKNVQQGVILCASSLVHAQKDEDVVCLGMVARALEKLAGWQKEKYFSINLLSLKRSLEAMFETKHIFFPTI